MNVQIICMGNLKEDYWRKASQEYEKRLSAFVDLEITEIPEERISQNPSQKEVKKALEIEGQKILDKIKPGSVNYIMAIEGGQMTSPQLAQRMQRHRNIGESQINFIIGSSHGLSEEVKKSGILFSFSLMTFPHQLMRILLLEQIYRGEMINHHREYHK